MSKGEAKSVNKFQPFLMRMIDMLPVQDLSARIAFYDKARTALVRTLHDNPVPVTELEVDLQRAALESAIGCIEASFHDSLANPEDLQERSMAQAEMPLTSEHRRFALNAAAGGGANLVKIGIQLVMLPIMARLLGPSEFGLYALALPTISFLTTLADGGLGASLAREEENSTAVWSTAFWLLIGTCTMMAVVAVLGGALIAHFSQQPRLTSIMVLLSLSLPLLALTALPAARLVRRGNLVVHSIADLVATLIGAAVALGLAILGAGAWALAIQYVVGGVVSCIIFNIAAFKIPTMQFSFSLIKSHLLLGGTIIASRLSELVGRQSENLLIGRYIGSSSLGSYTLANQTSRFLCDSVGNPVWGALYSYTLRGESSNVDALQLILTRILACILFPTTAIFAVAAPQIFDLSLGPRWASAASMMQIIVPSFALSTIASQCGAVMLARRQGSMILIITAFLGLFRIGSVATGIFIGVFYTSVGLVIGNVLFSLAMFASVRGESWSHSRSMMKTLIFPAIASVGAGAVCSQLLSRRPESILWLAVSSIAGCVMFAVIMGLLQRRVIIGDALALRRMVFKRH
ncbi:MAG: oligosaccharide flippase family protein [Janthinobacterium lividum]